MPLPSVQVFNGLGSELSLPTTASDHKGAPAGGTAEAKFSLYTDGDTSATSVEWLRPLGKGEKYQYYWTLVSGSLSTTPAAQNTWTALSATATWTLINSTDGTTLSAVFDVTVRMTGTTAPAKKCRVDLSADVIDGGLL